MSKSTSKSPTLNPPYTLPSKAMFFIFILFDILKNLLVKLRSIISGNVHMHDISTHIRAAFAPFDPDKWLEASSTSSQASESDVQVIDSGVSMPEALNTSLRELCRAIVRRDVKLITRIIEAAPVLLDTIHNNGWYAIHTAALTGDIEIVKLIASQPGVELGKLDTYKYTSNPTPEECRIRAEELSPLLKTVKVKNATALHYACKAGNMDVIKFLIDNGASPGQGDWKGQGPIEYFDDQHKEEMKEFHELYKNWVEREESLGDITTSLLERKIRKRDYEGFERLLKLKPSVLKQRCYYDYFLLHMATIRCLPRFVKLILDIDPTTVNVKDRRTLDNSALAYSSFASDRYPHKTVLDATALHYACLAENIELIEMLLKAGADWNLTDYKRRKPEDLIIEDAIGEQFQKLKNEEDARRKLKEEEESKKKAEEEAKKKAVEETNKKAGGSDLGKSSQEDEESDSESELSSDSESEDTGNGDEAFELEKVLGQKIVGQRGPVRAVANALRLRENGWVDPDRPLVMLFLGSSGVGKTEVAKQVALYKYGKDLNSTSQSERVNKMEKDCGFIRLDMSEYQHSHTVSNLTGSPKGYVGYEEGGYLTGRLAKNPNAIVLIDEIEKAHPNVLTVFLQVFDDGRITDPKKGVIYCKNATFIMTSNLASDEIKDRSPYLRRIVSETEAQGRPEEYMRLVGEFNRSIHPILKHALRRDEFLGRINEIIVFLPLDDEEISTVINSELKTWKRRAGDNHGIRLSWSREAVQKLTKSYDVNYGVRSVMHEVQRIAVQLIADAQIRGTLRKNWLAHLSADENGDCALATMDCIEPVKARRGCRYLCQ